MKVTVTLTEEIGKDSVYFVRDENGTSLKCFVFKTDREADDTIWGQNTALNGAIAYAKEVEALDCVKRETVIYETPDTKTE